MKKTLLAAAVLAGFAGAAHAQSTAVTLYGIIDIGLTYSKVKHTPINASGSRVGLASGNQSGSRWGLRGSEDLGDGLRAVFQVESGFDATNGDGTQGRRIFGRQATLGLAGDAWGTLEFGRQTNMASKYFGAIDPFGASFGQANIGHGLSSANTFRLDNLVLYRTPDFNGFQAGVGYSFSANAQTSARTTDNVRAFTTGLRYANGPLNIALSYDQLRPTHGFRNVDGGLLPNWDTKTKPRALAIGVTYDFEVVKLAGAYGKTRDGWFAGQNLGADTVGNTSAYGTREFAEGFKASSYMLGVTVPVGSGAIVSSWQRVNPNTEALTGSTSWQTGTPPNVVDKESRNDNSLSVISLGYTYDFSRRTNLYAFVSHAKNYAFIDGLKSTATGLGLRHRF